MSARVLLGKAGEASTPPHKKYRNHMQVKIAFESRLPNGDLTLSHKKTVLVGVNMSVWIASLEPRTTGVGGKVERSI